MCGAARDEAASAEARPERSQPSTMWIIEMKSLRTMLVLLTAFVAVFVEVSASPVRQALGAQVDLLPGLMVYASLSCGLPTVTALAVLGGLWFDSLSSNPLGVSMLPLLVVGLTMHKFRRLIMRSQPLAQAVMGMAASAVAPLLQLVILLNTDRQPGLGLITLWQWLVMVALGGLLTPLWFKIFDWLSGTLSPRRLDQTTFRTDREIKRGRF